MKGVSWMTWVPAALVATLVFLVVPGERTPRPINWLTTGGATKLEIQGGALLHYWYRGTEGPISKEAIEENIRVRADARGSDARVTFDGDGELHVELPKVTPSELRTYSTMLDTSGRLEFTMVVHNHEFSRRLYTFVDRDEQARRLGIHARIDIWRQENRSEPFYDYNLEASDRSALETYVFEYVEREGRPLPPDLRMAFERIVVRRAQDADTLYNEEPQEVFRSYLVEKDATITGNDVAYAQVVWNPITNYPEVLVTFTAEGSRAFGWLTSNHIGHKLAIMVNGDINSAPVVQGAILGGQITITMGWRGARQEKHSEAQALAGALRAGSLPIVFELVSAEPVEASAGRGSLLMARGLFALLCGLLCLAFLGIGRRLLAAPRAFKMPQPVFWLRLAATLALPVAVILLQRIELPTLDDNWGLHPLLEQSGAHLRLSMFALGLHPVFAAFILVELVALAIPALKRYRLGGPNGRAELGIAVAIVSLIFAALQAFFVMAWLAQDGALGDAPMLTQVATIATLMGGTAVLVILVWLVDTVGIGNGFSAVILTELVVEAIAWHDQLGLGATAGDVFVAGTAIAGIVLATLWITCRTVYSPVRTPTSGVVPLTLAFSVVAVFGLLLMLGLHPPAMIWDLLSDPGVPNNAYGPGGTWALFGTWGRFAFVLILIALLWAVFSFAFSRPAVWARTRHHLSGDSGPLDAPTMSVLRKPALLTGAYLVGVAVLYFAAFQWAPVAAFSLPVVIFSTAIIADFIAEARFRTHHPDLVAVWPIHRVQIADDVSSCLAEAGIDAHLRGVRHRSLLYVFGPYVPIHVMVPRDQAEAAHRHLSERVLRY